MELTPKKSRYPVIDFLKAVAMIGVVIDHSAMEGTTRNYLIYTVSLFVMAAGITTAISIDFTRFSYGKYLWKKARTLLLPYLLVSLANFIVNPERTYFSFNELKTSLLTFSASGHLYFLAFFMELLLIAPLLLKCYTCLNGKLYKNIGILICSALVSLGLAQAPAFEQMLAGGKYILGAGYFFMFNLGIFFWLNLRKCLTSPLVCGIGSIVSLGGLLLYDALLLPFKAWSNPPNVYAIIYTILVFFLLSFLYSLADWALRKRNRNMETYTGLLMQIGKNSLWIYFLHIFIIVYLEANNIVRYSTLPAVLGECVLMIFVPLVTVYVGRFFKKTAAKLWMRMRGSPGLAK